MNDQYMYAQPASPVTKLRICISGPVREHMDRIASALRGQDWVGVVTTGDGNLASLPALVAGSDPDLLVLALPKATVDDLDVLDRLAHLYPRMTPVLVSDQQTPDFLVRAMRAGVREVLPSASTIDDLVDSVGRIGVRRAAQPDKHGNVIAFISCKGGGGGATFLATNTAYALAASEGKRVILIDLNLQWGDAVFFLADKRPSITLADLALQMHRVDPAYLAASLVKVHPNLGVLGAPEDPVHALDIRPEHVELLLRIARMAYDYVVLDTGRALDAVTVRALDHADVIFPVMQISLPFIRDGKRLLSAFRALDYPPQKVRIVVNRYQKGGEISLKDLEDSLGIKAYRTIPNDYDRVSKSVNQGVPVDKLAHGSLVARSLREFAHELVAAPATAPPTWFDRIIRKT